MERRKQGRDLPPQAYRPHRVWMLTAVIGIGWFIPTNLLAVVLEQSRHHYDNVGDAVAQLLRMCTGGALGGVVSLGGRIAFLYWLHGAYRNLQPLGSTKPEISPGLPATGSDAVFSFLIPIVNLFRARRVMAHLWRESQPTAALLEDGAVLVPATRLVSWWYATWLLKFAALMLLMIAGSQSTLSPLALALAVQSLVNWLSAILGVVMMWTIEKRQAEQFRDLQLRRPAPPVTDQLR
ncbi:MAG TPA: DUF4328 domain-containing protein [Polyangia bacterium]|nr:DUF4328 domain-containing protein [Polyangia bacterium]